MGRLVRSNDRVFGGVCAGIAEFFGWNVGFLRLVWLVLSFVGVGSPVIFYFILWCLMPPAGRGRTFEERMRTRIDADRYKTR